MKYLEWPDELHLLQLLAGNSDHLVNDPDHFATFSIESLSPSKAEVRKETRYISFYFALILPGLFYFIRQRRRILSYLISHAVCCPSPVVRLSILRSVRHVSDSVKFQLLLPLIESQLSRPPSKGTDADVEKSILEAFDGSAAKDLNQEEDNSWNILNRALKFYHSLGKYTHSLQVTSAFVHSTRKKALPQSSGRLFARILSIRFSRVSRINAS